VTRQSSFYITATTFLTITITCCPRAIRHTLRGLP